MLYLLFLSLIWFYWLVGQKQCFITVMTVGVSDSGYIVKIRLHSKLLKVQWLKTSFYPCSCVCRWTDGGLIQTGLDWAWLQAEGWV